MSKVTRRGAPAPARPRKSLTLADEASHTAARAGLDAAMLADPFVDALFCRWAWPTGIRGTVVELAALPQRKLIAQLKAGALDCLFEPHRERFTREAQTLVRVHMPRLTWDFVATDLVEMFACEVLDEFLAAAFGDKAQAVREFQVIDQDPEIDIPLDATLEHLFARLTAAARRPTARRGRMPKNHGAALEEGARWLYRVWSAERSPKRSLGSTRRRGGGRSASRTATRPPFSSASNAPSGPSGSRCVLEIAEDLSPALLLTSSTTRPRYAASDESRE